MNTAEPSKRAARAPLRASFEPRDRRDLVLALLLPRLPGLRLTGGRLA